jgi:hypothetical protein
MRFAQMGGDGQFSFTVVDESHHQIELEDIVHFQTDESADFECIALLVPELHNLFDPDAIVVSIAGEKMGYLPGKAAARFSAARQVRGVDVAYCTAMILGGRDRGDDDVGHFGVKLDVSQPLSFENIRDWRSEEIQPGADAASHSASRSMIDGTSRAGQTAAQESARDRINMWRWPLRSSAAQARTAWWARIPTRPGMAVTNDLAIASPVASAANWQAPEASAAASSSSRVNPVAAVDRPRENIPLPRPRPIQLVRNP